MQVASFSQDAFPQNIELSENVGGARRDRTADLNTASVALKKDRNTNRIELNCIRLKLAF